MTSKPTYGVYGATTAAVPPYVLPNHAAVPVQQHPPPPAYVDVARPQMPNGVVLGGGGGYGTAAAAAAAAAPAAALPHVPQRPSQAPKEIDATTIAECMQEMKLKDFKEIERLNSLSDVYSIIRTMDRLEKAFIADQLDTREYETTCSKLIAQFKASTELIGMTMVDLPKFMAEHELNCKAALARFQISVPATVEHGLQSKRPGQHPRDVAECVQHFITAMDSLRLNMVAIDQLHPIISDIVQALNKITALPPDFEAKRKMKDWLKTLAALPASAELTEEQSRQLAFDLESSHNLFYQSL